MTILIAAALILTITGFLVLIDRKDKRHDQQLTKLLVHVQAPREAVAQAMNVPLDGPLYIPPEDDEAWREHHKAAS